MAKGGTLLPILIAVTVGAVVPLAVARHGDALSTLEGLVSSDGPAACAIKGNISIGSGEHIYHVPGQEHYDETIISPQYGERWFCTEAEARAAGWRRAHR